MSFSFDPTQISASGQNYISFTRFRLDDMDAACAELSDEIITAVYNDTQAESQLVRNYTTAIKCAQYLLTRYIKQPTFSSAGSSVQLAQRAEAWQQRVTDLAYELLHVSNRQPVIYPSRYDDLMHGEILYRGEV